ncbi:Uncharacterised protein [Vibrio cholerae]|nr:Uncharacterised protein [Vibrio cholerae]
MRERSLPIFANWRSACARTCSTWPCISADVSLSATSTKWAMPLNTVMSDQRVPGLIRCIVMVFSFTLFAKKHVASSLIYIGEQDSQDEA